MRVRLKVATKLAYDGQVLELPAGHEADGDLAEHLVRNRVEVEILEGEPGDTTSGDSGWDQVRDGAATPILDWVGTDRDRAAHALAAETGPDGKARVGLTAKLEELAAVPDDPAAPDGTGEPDDPESAA